VAANLVVSSLSLRKAPPNVTALVPSVLTLVKMLPAVAAVDTFSRMSRAKSLEM
jgi:hypothetical protein